jgi:hypothetical protein
MSEASGCSWMRSRKGGRDARRSSSSRRRRRMATQVSYFLALTNPTPLLHDDPTPKSFWYLLFQGPLALMILMDF